MASARLSGRFNKRDPGGITSFGVFLCNDGVVNEETPLRQQRSGSGDLSAEFPEALLHVREVHVVYRFHA